jgi:hypothetical protein
VSKAIYSIDMILEEAQVKRQFPVEKAASGDFVFSKTLDWIQPESQRVMIEHAIHQLNIALFSCEIKELVNVKKLSHSSQSTSGTSTVIHSSSGTMGSVNKSFGSASIPIKSSSNTVASGITTEGSQEASVANDESTKNDDLMGNVTVHVRKTTTSLKNQASITQLMEMALGYSSAKIDDQKV